MSNEKQTMSEMARYIDADALLERMRLTYCKDCNSYNEVMCRSCLMDDALTTLEDCPTADVVPKSEVIRALNEVELLIIITKEVYKQQMEDATNELSKQSKRTKWIAFEKFYEQFAELKKEYTEEKII